MTICHRPWAAVFLPAVMYVVLQCCNFLGASGCVTYRASDESYISLPDSQKGAPAGLDCLAPPFSETLTTLKDRPSGSTERSKGVSLEGEPSP